MNPNIIFKPTTDKLKNAIAAIVGKGIRTIRRFTTALHNRCNLVVYVDNQGRTCCQFLKKDAFSGYHFAFSGNECEVTNKESGEVYTVNFTAFDCTCPAYKYDRSKQPCKHIRMVSNLATKNREGLNQTDHPYLQQITQKNPPYFSSFTSVAELKGNLEQAIALTQLGDCTHPKAIIGLDGFYCPDCKKSIERGTALYEEILNRDNKPHKKTKKAFEIDPNDVPTGCRLKRTDDWMSVEYDVLAYRMKNHKQLSGELWRHLVQENIGRIVEHPQGIYTYRVRSGTARIFESVQDAIAFLVQVVGTNFDEIAAAHWEFNSF